MAANPNANLESQFENVRRYTPRTVVYDADPNLKLTPAAVMLLIHRERQSLLFMLRSDRVGAHRGQIGLPGGRVEAGETPREAALRETHEEVGLRADSIELVGEIDRLQTITNYLVHPFVARWEQVDPLVPDEREVQELFETPLAFFLDPANCRREVWSRKKANPGEIEPEARPGAHSKDMYFWYFKEREIWGVTGDILESFFFVMTGERLRDLVPESNSRRDDFYRRYRR